MIYSAAKKFMQAVTLPKHKSFTPVATTGFLIAFPENETMPLTISVEKAIKPIVSGGIVSPKIITEIPRDANMTNSEVSQQS